MISSTSTQRTESCSVMSDSFQLHGHYNLPGSSVCGILQARILEWVAYSFLQGIFPTQGSNLGLPHCGRILYHLSHQEIPTGNKSNSKKYSARESPKLRLSPSYVFSSFIAFSSSGASYPAGVPFHHKRCYLITLLLYIFIRGTELESSRLKFLPRKCFVNSLLTKVLQ